jgi:hypothetical protein
MGDESLSNVFPPLEAMVIGDLGVCAWKANSMLIFVKVLLNFHNFFHHRVIIIAREIEQKLGPGDDERIEY